jgi:hypothetical protein
MTLARQTCSEAFWAVSGTPTKHALSNNNDPANGASLARAWTSEGMADLHRLLGIMTNLLHMKPFDVDGSQSENGTNALVVKPLTRNGPTMYGAVGRVENLVRMVMVRTR